MKCKCHQGQGARVSWVSDADLPGDIADSVKGQSLHCELRKALSGVLTVSPGHLIVSGLHVGHRGVR